MKLPAFRTLPKPVKWLGYALGVYVAYKLIVLALIILSIAVSIIWMVAAAALMVAIVYALLHVR